MTQLTAFDWPLPPYFQAIHDGHKDGPETCLIYMRNGSKALGELIRFVPEESSLLFLPTRAETNEVIPLSDIKSMRLVKSLILNKHQTTLEARAEEVFPPSERQSYSVEFVDKEIVNGETIGYSNSNIGLYLYLPTVEDKVIRCFIP